MKAEALLALYERVADAPDAIARLRRFVLDLAVRGKLVGQDPEDEPALCLLRQISEAMAEPADSGRSRRKTQPTPVAQALHSIPSSWEWVPIRQITSDRGQAVPDSAFTYIDVTAINKERGLISEPKVLSADEAPSRARKIVRRGDVVYSCVRPYLLNVAVVEEDFAPSPIASTAFAVLDSRGFVLPRYIWIVLRSPPLVAKVEESQRGQAYPAINDADFAVLPFPLPPLAEQHRIVAKVDELMALLDRVDAARSAREATRDRLTTASLTRLTAPDTDPEALRTHARFALDALPALTTRADQIKQLRQTIIDLAVAGRLLEQAHSDGTGLELLAATRREGLPKRLGRASRASALSVSGDEHRLPVPSSWTWASLVELGVTQTGSSPSSSRPELLGEALPFIKPGDMDGATIDYSGPGLSEEGALSARVAPESSVLMVCIGATLGKVGVTTQRVSFNQQINSISPHVPEMASYIALALRASSFQRNAWSRAGTGTLPIISKGKWETLQIPVPPLAEQHRIVAKVDELMALCARLEVALQAADTARARLLEALLHEALAGERAQAA